MAYLLAGDIGGTKTLMQLCATGEEVPLLQKSFVSADYASLSDIVGEFLMQAGVHDIASACLAVAGPVTGRVAMLTNLPWAIDADALATNFGIRHVTLINDFEAVGQGIAAMQDADLLTLQAGNEQAQDVRLVVGAGTGLGVAWLTPAQGAYQVHPSEGGHMDFAPVDELQISLMQYLQRRHGHVSFERIVSGPGLIAIFEFMRDTGLALPSPQLLAAMEKDDPAAAISYFSTKVDEEIARKSVDLFLTVYGAFVGNLALAALPRGGIFVAGGIAAKMALQMRNGIFMHAFLSKGRFNKLLATLPVHIVLNQNVGLVGASLVAQRLAWEPVGLCS